MTRSRLAAILSLAASIPALLLGVLTMRQLDDVPATAWMLNLAAAVVGLLLFAIVTYAARPWSQRAWYVVTIASIAIVLSTFAAHGLDGVHRWIFLGRLGLHASAIVAPLIIACVATAPSRPLMIAAATVTALLLALQPDAAQACSFALACAVILFDHLKFAPRKLTIGLALLIACAIASLLRLDPLKPVRHVEGIFDLISARGTMWALLATVALLLLPLPFLVAWRKNRHSLALALGVYVAMVTLAHQWGAFPVPIMGAGVSPILGYFLALAFALSANFNAPSGPPTSARPS